MQDGEDAGGAIPAGDPAVVGSFTEALADCDAGDLGDGSMESFKARESRRLQQNREAAKRFRQKKKNLMNVRPTSCACFMCCTCSTDILDCCSVSVLGLVVDSCAGCAGATGSE